MVLVLALVCVLGLVGCGQEEYMDVALAYLEEQKAALYEAERIPIELDPQTD